MRRCTWLFVLALTGWSLTWLPACQTTADTDREQPQALTGDTSMNDANDYRPAPGPTRVTPKGSLGPS